MPNRRRVDPGTPEHRIAKRLLLEAMVERQNQGLTQRDMGKLTGYSQPGINTLEAGKTPMFSVVTLIRYWLAMGYDDVRLVPVKKEEE
jgi:transcriptional regulator with XRE-family HTH domain